MKRFRTNIDKIEDHFRVKDLKRKRQILDNRWYSDYRPGQFSYWEHVRKLMRKLVGKNINTVLQIINSKIKSDHTFNTTKNVFDNIYKGVHECIDKSWFEFVLDSQNRLQLSRYRMVRSRRNYYSKVNVLNKRRRKTYTVHKATDINFYFIHNFWNSPQVIVLRNSALFKQLSSIWKKNMDAVEITIDNKQYRVELEYTPKKVSKEKFKQCSIEYAQKKKLRRLSDKKQRKEIVYDMLTSKERLLKETRELDQQKLLSHGFDEESFKGEPYHGQKRKRK